MKAILKFSLPEEESEFYYAQNGVKFASALSELDNWLRNKIKYESISEKELEAYNNVRKELFELLDDLDIHR